MYILCNIALDGKWNPCDSMQCNAPCIMHHVNITYILFFKDFIYIKSANILLLPSKYEIIVVPSNHYSNIAIAILHFFLLLLVKLSILILFASFLVSVLSFFFDGSNNIFADCILFFKDLFI